MGIKKAMKKAAHSIYSVRELKMHPTSYLLSFIIEAAAHTNPLLQDMSISCRKSKFVSKSREIRVFDSVDQICVFTIPNGTDLITAVEITAGQISKELTKKTEDVDIDIQKELPFGTDFERGIEYSGGDFFDNVKEVKDDFYPKKVYFSPTAWNKMFQVLDVMAERGLEVAFFGYVKVHDTKLVVMDVDVPIQSAYSVTFNIPAASRFKVKNPEDVNCMIHSHKSMFVFFSGTDEGDFRKECQGTGGDRIYLSLVANTRREFYGKIFTASNKEVAELEFGGIDKTIMPPYAAQMLKRINGSTNGQSSGSISVSVEVPK